MYIHARSHEHIPARRQRLRMDTNTENENKLRCCGINHEPNVMKIKEKMNLLLDGLFSGLAPALSLSLSLASIFPIHFDPLHSTSHHVY